MKFFKKRKLDASILGEIDRINREDIEMLKEIDDLATEVLEMSVTCVKHFVDTKDAAPVLQEKEKQKNERNMHTRKSIARELGITPKTIYHYCRTLERQGSISPSENRRGTKFYTQEERNKIISFYKRLKGNVEERDSSGDEKYTLIEMGKMAGVSRNTMHDACIILEERGEIKHTRDRKTDAYLYSKEDAEKAIQFYKSQKNRRI